MKPVDQLILHDPSNNKIGDCYRACIASILELNIEDVPHFMIQEPRQRIKSLLQFLGEYGYTLYSVEGLVDYTYPDENDYYIVSGISPKDSKIKHAVIGYNGKIVHDPHPDKSGIISYDYSEIFLKVKTFQ
jgi:hypothetical protein